MLYPNNNNYHDFYSNPQEEDLFSLTFTQDAPILSYGSSSSIENSPISSYKDELLLNHYNINGYLDSRNYNKNGLTISDNDNSDNSNNNNTLNRNDDLVFELDNDFISSIKQQTSTTTNLNQIPMGASKNIPDSFANIAQQNYRLWLSTV